MIRIFAVAHRYAAPDKRYSQTEGTLGIVYIEANDAEDAKRKYGHTGVVAVKEITLDEFFLTGAK
jgi:hypothetical protein